MWYNNLKFAVSLQIKQVQFRLNTWRQSREIARAYGEKKSSNVRVLVACLICAIILAVGAPNAKRLPVLGKGMVSLICSIPHNIQVSVLIPKFAPKQHAPSVARETPKKTAAFTPPKGVPAPDTGKKSVIPETPVKDAGPGASSLQPALPDTAGLGKISAMNATGSTLAMNYCILANKADRTLYLLSKTGGGENWKSIEQFSILVGKNDGQKISAGDQRTPEGIYFIVGRRETEELDAIYGPLAYMLNYPNEDDRKAGRTGQGIWIHGTREDTTREATRGCVVLDNDDIRTLSRYLFLGIGTPVVIVNTDGLTAPEQAMNFRLIRALRERILFEYNTRRAEFTGVLSQWKQAWESRDIENYSKFYDPDRFFGEGMRWDAWRDKKQRTFQNYTSINIGLDKICVSEFSESTAVILFVQRYESNVLRVQRPKKLSFFKSDGRWRIFKEETYTRQELVL
jgi:murein L,D-transpeptidase YafK